MKIVTGIGRCGTSAMVEYAKSCNMNVGKIKWIEKYDAGNENGEFMQINNHIFKLGSDGGINRQIANFNLDIVKDPLFIRDTNTVSSWWAVRKDIEIIYCERPFKDIMESQKRKPQMTTPAYRCFIDEMARIQSDFLNKCASLGVPVKRIQYPFSGAEEVNKVLGLNNDGQTYKRIIR